MGKDTSDQSTTPEAVVEPIKTKKKHNVPAIVLAFFMLAFAGAAIFFGIKYFEPKENKPAEPTTADEIKEDKKSDVTTKTIADDYKEVEEMVGNLSAGIEKAYGTRNGQGLTYKPEGLNTHIPTRLTIVEEIMIQNNERAIYAALESNFKKSGFESIGTLPFLGSAGPKIDGYLNASRNIVCGVSEDSEWGYGGAQDFVYLECAKTDWTWLTKDEKALVAELEAAYHEKTGEYPTTIHNFGNSNPKNSKQEPYQTLSVSLGGGFGLFYRTSPDAKWQFFTGGQAPPDCSEYNTEDLKKAYLGEFCYNGLAESTVQL